MKFLLDENFPKAAVVLLRSSGHEVFDIRGTDDEGMEDDALFRKAQVARAVLLTTDRDFFHTVPHLYDEHCGVVVIALRQPNRAAILSRLEWALSTITESDFPNRVFQFRDKTWLAYPSIGGS
jgi:predicted nuclease of predicted toxin-antitoxin system